MDSSLAAPAVWASSPFRVPLQSELSPEQAVLWLRGDKRPFALIGDWLGGGAVLGSEPRSLAPHDCDPFSLLGSLAPRTGGSEATIGGGWVGWLGYELGARIECLPPPPPPRSAAPAFSLAFYDHVVLFDGERWWFEGLGTPGREATLRRRLEVWEARLCAAPAPLRAPTRLRFSVAANGSAGHVAAVADCRERIVSGELLQANICLRLESRFGGDPIDLFALALTRVRPRFGALVDGLVSLSPERFLRREGRRVWSEPIKGTGTRRQQQDSGSDELLRSAKDAAEHVMIVDLMRNDLGRVCAYGTVSADTRRIEPHGALWHMVSTVSGRLRDDVDDGALLRATFPPGSVTGAPKVQAMKVIASLESTRREAYTGAIGIVSPVAGLDMSVAIRTFELSGGDIWLGAGGGIVADSEAESELAEALAKASGPIGAIAGWIDDRTRPAWRRSTPVASRALLFGRRPDPAHGVFETVLIEDGVAVLLDAHLERLAASVRALYGIELAPDTRSRLTAAATATLAR
ncbi:MAG TPA: chorismate-binding protein, partial [Solirubrobacteraceae bacterium]